ncbi:hypothetical protein NDN08_006816 [Rhodosorus marinus]|uniref:UBC core domain-containing protein n=1 Tax=Rhodosorus marinus TaxID=101924 RepID=A0AAV8UP57_9RHOD|nr:hypothetical protein NDN08_006816 [Rhodosorus marinus]
MADGQVAKRLQSELMNLMMEGVPGVSAFPDGDNYTQWTGTIHGSDVGPYKGMKFQLSLVFPKDYPYSAPTVKFMTGCFHPNVDMSGNICLDILKDKWSATYTVKSILLSIQSLLDEPNNDSPLNNQAASLWSQQEEYKRLVAKKYAEG